ncbi:hypothetical protein K9B35_00210 [Sphingomonas sp. R647]|uniref:hypothetical protein n=1 Tax=Sphingomonas sp. R647 TaxID=2875233 RepID=UPI001CD7AE44|nr:hypothetical protein [Sphingomonas sp. R647]MCA1196377.1 hypothetical protein [Sphingomonas sp. R647]
MRIAKTRLSLGLAFITLLSACGGGGSGTVTAPSTGSSPTPSPGVSPSPAPGPGAASGELKPSADATFIAALLQMTTTVGTTSELTGQTSGGTTSNRSVTLDTPGFSASYSVGTGYSLADSFNRSIFGLAQLTSDTTASDPFHPTVLFTRPAAGAVDYLALYKFKVTTTSILGSGSVEPRYGGVGGWQHSIADPGARRTRLNYFAFGPVTPVAAMPRSGVVKFTLMGSGNYAGDSDLYFASQSDTITVDFGTGSVTGSLSANGSNLFTGGFGGIYSARLNGTISGNAVAGPTSSSVAVASGEFRLLFVGPSADEIIVTHVGQNGRGHYVSAAVGVRNPYLP